MQRLLTALGGPVFAKEMLETARRKRYYFNRVLFGLALFIAIWVVFADNSYRMADGLTIRDAADIAQSLFIGVAVVQHCAVWLLAPLFVCGLVASERESHTLDLLLTSRLRDREIVIGKLTSRLAIVVLVLLCSLPIVAIVGTFGGVDARVVWRSLNATLVAMLVAGAFSIYFSVRSRSPIGAMVRTYWWMALWLVAVPFATMLVIELFFSRPTSTVFLVVVVLMMVDPILAFAMAMTGEMEIAIAGWVGNWFSFWYTLVAPTLLSAWLVWRAVRRLRHDPTEAWAVRVGRYVVRALPGARVVAEGRRERRALQREGARRWLRIVPVANPVWLRARLARVYDREGHIGRIQLGMWAVAIGFLAIAATEGLDNLCYSGVAMAFLAPIWIAFGLLVVVVSASSLVSDKRRGFFDLMLVTTISPKEVFDGTLLAVWQHVRRTWWLAAALTMLFTLTGAVAPEMALVSLVSGTLFAAVVASVGVSTSLAATALPQSLIPTIALPLIMTAGIGAMPETLRDSAAPTAWILGAMAWTVAFTWTRGSVSAPAVGAFFVVAHMTIALASTGYAISYGLHFAPLLLCNPAVLIIGVLDGHSVYEQVYWRHSSSYVDVKWFVAAWWGALAVNIAWMRWWVVRRFDRITGRMNLCAPQTTRPVAPQHAARPSVAIPSAP